MTELPIIKPFLDLLRSRKALMVGALNIVLIALVGAGKVPWVEVKDVFMWVNAAWLGAHALEASGKARADASKLVDIANILPMLMPIIMRAFDKKAPAEQYTQPEVVNPPEGGMQ